MRGVELGSHWSAARLEGLRPERVFPSRFAPADLVGLVVHLTDHCRVCWAAVDQLPDLEVLLDPALDPAIAALRRLGQPRSWHGLASDHLDAVTTVRWRNLGFAFLVLEEARTQAVAALLRDQGDVSGLLAYHATLGLLETLLSARDPSPEQHDLLGLAATHVALMETIAGRPQDARESLAAAASHAERGSGAVATRVNLLNTALRLLGEDHRWRRVEILDVIARMYEGLKKQRQLRRVLEHLLLELDRIQAEPSPMLQVAAIHRAATIRVRYAKVLAQRHRELARSARDLEGAQQLYADAVDPSTQAERYHLLGCLYSEIQPPRAEACFVRARRLFAELGDVAGQISSFAGLYSLVTAQGRSPEPVLAGALQALSSQSSGRREQLGLSSDVLAAKALTVNELKGRARQESCRPLFELSIRRMVTR